MWHGQVVEAHVGPGLPSRRVVFCSFNKKLIFTIATQFEGRGYILPNLLRLSSRHKRSFVRLRLTTAKFGGSHQDKQGESTKTDVQLTHSMDGPYLE
jgi:hypothetical protein